MGRIWLDTGGAVFHDLFANFLLSIPPQIVTSIGRLFYCRESVGTEANL